MDRVGILETGGLSRVVRGGSELASGLAAALKVASSQRGQPCLIPASGSLKGKLG